MRVRECGGVSALAVEFEALGEVWGVVDRLLGDVWKCDWGSDRGLPFEANGGGLPVLLIASAKWNAAFVGEFGAVLIIPKSS